MLERKWQRIKASKDGPWVSYLLFTDDVLLFTRASTSQARVVAQIFDKFSKASGLKVNIAKSRAFYSLGVPRSTIEHLTSISQIRSIVALDKYLGFPLLKGRVKKSDFEFIIEKLRSRLASWKLRFLNKPRRLALASLVLNSLPTYYMQMFWLPQSICSLIVRTSRDFIWKGNSGRGIHLVGWDKISLSKKQGGLGVRRARDANTALLGKLVWDLQQHSNKLWVQVLSKKYNIRGNFLSGSKTTGSAIWNSIRKAQNVLREGYSLCVGAGNISFWYEPWSKLGMLCNCVEFVAIHDIDVKVNNVVTESGINFQHLCTNIPATLKEEIRKLQININPRILVAYIWKDSIKGVYTAKAGYTWLLEKKANGLHGTSWSWIWKTKASETVKFLLWLACHDAVPTCSLLHRRGMLHTSYVNIVT